MDRGNTKPPGTPRLGFLGPTSFGATLHESGRVIGSLLSGSVEHTAADDQWGFNFPRPNRPEQIEKGARCLALLQNMPNFQPLIDSWYQYLSAMSMNALWLHSCTRALKDQIYDGLSGKDDAGRDVFLLGASTRIFENTLKPLGIASDCSVGDFAASFTTESLRWEAVGIYFASLGEASMAFYHINARVPGSHLPQGQPGMTNYMLEASDVCRSFCEEIGQMTDPEIWLQIENCYVWSLIAGDASYTIWQRIGDLVSACVVRGLHEEISVASGIPFWLSEMRKRAFARIYSEDKQLSSFVGRPPRLPRKYCVIQIPLDLENGELKLSGPDLEQAVNGLDDQGWNQRQYLGLEVCLRAQLITNMVREDILEFSLTPFPVADASYAQDLVSRSEAVWHSMPEFIRDPKNVKGPDAWLTKSIFLNFCYNDFLLQRAMVKKLDHPKVELIRLSRVLLSGVLEIVNAVSQYGQFATNMPWSLAKYGLPSAGVLCLELLQERQPWSSSSLSPHRSEVIQRLSSLVACLKWAVTKHDGNYKICLQARELIQRILDRVLNEEVDQDPQPRSLNVKPQWRGSTTEDAVFSWNAQAMTKSEPEFWSSLLPNHPLLA